MTLSASKDMRKSANP
jgi:hypothetical protein